MVEVSEFDLEYNHESHLSGSCNILEHLLHVGVLIPELVGSGQDGHSTVPHIASMVHL